MRHGLALVLAGATLLGSAVTASAEVPRRGLRAEIAALLMQGVAGGSLPVAAAVFPAPAAASGATGELAFLLELPPAPAEGAGEARPLEVYAYALDAADQVVASFGLTVPDWPAAGEGLKVAGRLPTPLGQLSLRFLAWDPGARRYGMAVRRIDSGAAPPLPRLAEECADWATAGEGPPDLLKLSARPVLIRGEVRRLTLGAPIPPGDWRVRFVRENRAETVVEEAVAKTVGAEALEFVVPDLPAGIYQLSVTATGDADRGSRPIESWLVADLPPADSGCRRSWGRVLRLARAGLLPAGVEQQTAMPEGRPLSRLRTEYAALLRRLATAGDLTSSSAELADLEVPIVEEDIERLRPLFAAELETVRELAQVDARCLLPLVTLHAEVYRVHYRAGRFPLATHSRSLAGAIADLSIELLKTPGERSLVAVALAGLAEMLDARKAFVEAQRLLERALELDPELEAARLLLAVSYDRKGRHVEARRHLESLVAANSAHYEARVRLAVLLRRMGDGAGAERLLRVVVSERPPDWLLSLAYQTLVQMQIRGERIPEALTDLEQAIRRLPGDQVLQILLAYARDRAGERRAVQEILAALPPAAAGETPRYRYSDAPAAELGLLRETLRQSVTVRLPVLAQVLDLRREEGATE